MSTVCGDRIKRRREELHMTQKELAAKIGFSAPRNITNYEKGERSPDLETLCRIAKALSCTTDYLLGLEDAHTHEAASIAEQTGLSGIAVEVLIGFRNDPDSSYIQSIGTFISDILSSEDVVGLSDSYHIWKKLVFSPKPTTPADLQMIPGQVENNLNQWRKAFQSLFEHDHIIAGARYDITRQFEAFLSDIEHIANIPDGLKGRIAEIYREEAIIKQLEEMNKKGDAVGIEDLLNNRRKDNGKGKK